MTATNRPLTAALWMTGSIAAFTAMAVATRAIRATHDTFEILAYRSIIGLVLVLALAMAAGRLRRITARRLPSHAVRNVVHFTGQALWFWALTQIPWRRSSRWSSPRRSGSCCCRRFCWANG